MRRRLEEEDHNSDDNNNDLNNNDDADDDNNNDDDDTQQERRRPHQRRRISTSPNNNDRNNATTNDDLEDSPIASRNNQNTDGRNDRMDRLNQLAARRRRQQQLEQELETEEKDNDDDEAIPFAGESDQYQEINTRVINDDDDENVRARNNDNDLNDSDDDSNIDGDNNDNDNEQPDEEEEDDGEDLLENMDRDYQRIEALDTYGTEGIDDTEYDHLDMNEREAAERELSRRDRELGHKRRSDGFYGLLDRQEDDEDEEARLVRRGMFGNRKQRSSGDRQDDEEDGGQSDGDADGGDVTDEEDLDGDDIVNLEAFDVPLREWIAQERTRSEIQRRFRKFIRHFIVMIDDNINNESDNDAAALHRRRTRAAMKGNGLYEQKIRTMCASNLSTLQISYIHLMESEPIIAYWLADAPKDMFVILNEAATRHTLFLFSSYHVIQKEIHVRISDVPIIDSLRDLRKSHLNCLVKVHGVVTRRSAVFPQLQLAYYTCNTCKNVQGPIRVLGGNNTNQHPDSCPNCDITTFRLHTTLSQYRNIQHINLQESPGSVPPGRAPRTKEIILMDDLIDYVRPGEDAEVTGIYEHTFDSSLTFKSGFPVFSTSITANHIHKREDSSSANNLSEYDIRQILELSRDPKIGDRIIQSIAPSIYGHEYCKMALAMALFAGVPKHMNDKHRIRGDVNVLLLGDPGTAKSQLLKYAQHTAPRAVYSTGKGASAVGLTASVHKDPITREWTLEGGALVLADKGICLIDEFDKMNEQDRTSIHEAMEQQSISISKAGIVTSLQARCSVIAAANPIGGRYDSSNTLSENVELTDPILQRFDILCVLQDIVDPVNDERLATFVTNSHMNSTPTSTLIHDDTVGSIDDANSKTVNMNNVNNTNSMIPQQLLRKYIQYARTNVKPVLRNNTFDQEKIASLYVALRRESAASGGVPIAVRHIESILRMSEAYAKMHLRDYVRDDDLNVAIQMMLHSFIDSQKFSVRRSLKRSFAKYIVNPTDRIYLLLHILQDMFRKEQLYQTIRQRQQAQHQLDNVILLEIPMDEFESRAREKRIYDVIEFCTSHTAFIEAGYIYDNTNRIISRSFMTTSTTN